MNRVIALGCSLAFALPLRIIAESPTRSDLPSERTKIEALAVELASKMYSHPSREFSTVQEQQEFLTKRIAKLVKGVTKVRDAGHSRMPSQLLAEQVLPGLNENNEVLASLVPLARRCGNQAEQVRIAGGTYPDAYFFCEMARVAIQTVLQLRGATTEARGALLGERTQAERALTPQEKTFKQALIDTFIATPGPKTLVGRCLKVQSVEACELKIRNQLLPCRVSKLECKPFAHAGPVCNAQSEVCVNSV